MDTTKILTVLHHEHERVSAAIKAIERLMKVKDASGSSMKRRGRPPGSKNKPKAEVPQR
jgi:hypothetical protein